MGNLREPALPASRAASAPAVAAGGDTAASDLTRDALARAQAAETLVDLYDAWLRLQVARAEAAAARARGFGQLDARAQFLLGTVETARRLAPESAESAETAAAAPAPTPTREVRGEDVAALRGVAAAAAVPAPGLVPAFEANGQPAHPVASTERPQALAQRAEVDRFLASVRAELDDARSALLQRTEQEERLFDERATWLRDRIERLADSMLAHHRPCLELVVQPVGAAHCLLHATRPTPDDAVLLCRVLSGKLFTRYDAFFDDSIEAPDAPPPRFYSADEGAPSSRSLDAEDAISEATAQHFAPFKSMIPIRVPATPWPRFRLLNRGPVAEVVARREGGDYEPLLERAAAELLTGWLVRLQMEGRLDLALRFA